MKKILFITPTLGGGGAERRLTNLAILLQQRGYDVTVLAYFSDDCYGLELEKNGVRVVKILGNYCKRIIVVPWFIIKGNFDACISLLPTPSFLNCLAARIHKGRRVVITGESSCEEGQFYYWQGKLYARFRRFSDVIVCNSQRAKEMWLRHFPNYNRKLKVIYNPVRLAEVPSCYTPKINGRLHIVIASSVYETKNPIGLINALQMMTQPERSRICIDWYGRKSTTKNNGGEYIKAENLIERYHLSNVLKFHEPTTDIINIVNKADVSALFSRLEGLPNAICEGMMLGKPIIMTRVSDFDILVDSTNGLLCDWDNPVSIKDAILQLADKSIDELKRMGAASRRKAQILFDNEMVINEWISIIEMQYEDNRQS